jgi:sensor histidine kinase YesM
MLLNPVIRRLSNFAVYIIFWFLLTLINIVVLTTGLKLDFMYAAWDSIIFNSILALLSLSYWYTVQYIPFEKTSLVKIIFSHFTASLAASAIWIMLSYFLLNNIFSGESYQIFLFNSLGWRFLSGIIFYFFIASLYYVIAYYSEVQERIKKESELKSLVSLAELKTLKYQLNPHFLFNALNSLSALTSADPVAAGSMTIKISDFLRYSLSNNEKQKNKLAEEINILKLYMDIEKIRFGDKVEFSEVVDDSCLDIEVPNMILHPLIENAFKHAVYEAIGVINISLAAAIKNESLNIILSNNYEEQSHRKKGEGVGLKNTSSRLNLMYDGKGRLDIKDEQGIFSVKLVIPLEVNHYDAPEGPYNR